MEGYVPDIMCPGDVPDGDYVIMDIDEKGKISNWKNPQIPIKKGGV